MWQFNLNSVKTPKSCVSLLITCGESESLLGIWAFTASVTSICESYCKRWTVLTLFSFLRLLWQWTALWDQLISAALLLQEVTKARWLLQREEICVWNVFYPEKKDQSSEQFLKTESSEWRGQQKQFIWGKEAENDDSNTISLEISRWPTSIGSCESAVWLDNPPSWCGWSPWCRSNAAEFWPAPCQTFLAPITVHNVHAHTHTHIYICFFFKKQKLIKI